MTSQPAQGVTEQQDRLGPGGTEEGLSSGQVDLAGRDTSDSSNALRWSASVCTQPDRYGQGS